MQALNNLTVVTQHRCTTEQYPILCTFIFTTGGMFFGINNTEKQKSRFDSRQRRQHSYCWAQTIDLYSREKHICGVCRYPLDLYILRMTIVISIQGRTACYGTGCDIT